MRLSLHSDFKVCNLCFYVQNVTVSERMSSRKREMMDRERERERREVRSRESREI